LDFHTKQGWPSKVASATLSVQRAFVTRMRYALARPSSVVSLSHGEFVYYNEGILCYVQEEFIRILDVYKVSEIEEVVDMRALLAEEAARWPLFTADIQELLSKRFWLVINRYERGILSLDVFSKFKRLVIINVPLKDQNVPLKDRVRKVRNFTKYSHHVRTDGRYAIYVPYSRYNNEMRNAAEWTVECYDLEDKDRIFAEIAATGNHVLQSRSRHRFPDL